MRSRLPASSPVRTSVTAFQSRVAGGRSAGKIHIRLRSRVTAAPVDEGHAEGRGFESLQPLWKRPAFAGRFRCSSRVVRLRHRTMTGQSCPRRLADAVGRCSLAGDSERPAPWNFCVPAEDRDRPRRLGAPAPPAPLRLVRGRNAAFVEEQHSQPPRLLVVRPRERAPARRRPLLQHRSDILAAIAESAARMGKEHSAGRSAALPLLVQNSSPAPSRTEQSNSASASLPATSTGTQSSTSATRTRSSRARRGRAARRGRVARS
jgi:hypothetical protein